LRGSMTRSQRSRGSHSRIRLTRYSSQNDGRKRRKVTDDNLCARPWSVERCTQLPPRSSFASGRRARGVHPEPHRCWLASTPRQCTGGPQHPRPRCGEPCAVRGSLSGGDSAAFRRRQRWHDLMESASRFASHAQFRPLDLDRLMRWVHMPLPNRPLGRDANGALENSRRLTSALRDRSRP